MLHLISNHILIVLGLKTFFEHSVYKTYSHESGHKQVNICSWSLATKSRVGANYRAIYVEMLNKIENAASWWWHTHLNPALRRQRKKDL